MSVQQRPRGRGRAQNGQISRGSNDTGLTPNEANRSGARSRRTSPNRSLPTAKGLATNQSRPSNNIRGMRSGRGARGRPSPLWREIQNDSGDESWRDPKVEGNTEYKERMHDLWQTLKKSREQERKDAIKNGFLADPDRPTSLAHAITPVGTCQDMCPEFERVERIVQLMVDGCEKTAIESSDAKVPNEKLMVKRFRRSAAGYDEQLPSDIRPPAVLQKTLNYLFDELLGSHSLASAHKFLWDRTRGIRNDFSIQQVTKADDLRIAIDCFERIARFHILSLHQLSHPSRDNGEFDHHQEREQLNNTLLSLMYYYDDSRHKLTSPNEAEFRAYCIIFEIRDLRPDIEDRAQNWPRALLKDSRIQTAFKLYAAAGNTSDAQGPLRPQTPFSIAQSNYAAFWSIVRSNMVSYLMACAAEIYFNLVRTRALEAIWKAYRRPGTIKLEDWILGDVAIALGFDNEEQTQRYCEDHGFTIGEREDGEAFLDLGSVASNWLEDSNTQRKQLFSKTLVEKKRLGRTLSAVIDGMSVSRARAEGYIDESSIEEDTGADETLFVSDESDEGISKPETTAKQPVEKTAVTTLPSTFGQPSFTLPSATNPPEASRTNPFFASTSTGSPFNAPSTSTFGLPSGPLTTPNPFAKPTNPNPAPSTTPFPTSNTPKFNFTIATSVTSTAPDLVAPSPAIGPGLSAPPGPATSTPATRSANFGQTSTSDTQPYSVLAAPPSTPPDSESSSPKTTSSTFNFTIPKPVNLQASNQSPSSPFHKFEATNPDAAPQAFPTPSNPPSLLFQNSLSNSKLHDPTPFLPFTTSVPSIQTSTPDIKSIELPSQASGSATTVSKSPAGGKAPPPLFSFPAPSPPNLDRKNTTSGSLPQQPLSQPLPQPLPQLSTISNVDTTSPRPLPTPLEPKSSPFQKPYTPPRPTAPPIYPPKPDLRPKALDELARATVCENDGLLQQFIEFAISPTIVKAISQVNKERVREEIASARRLLLGKKYFRKWKQKAWKKALLRKGKERRKNFAESLQAMALSRSQSRETSRTPSETPNFEASRIGRTGEAVMPPPARPANSDSKRKRNSLPDTIEERPTSSPSQRHEKDIHPNNSTQIAGLNKRPTKSHHKRSQTLESPSRMIQSGRVSKPGSAFSPRSSFLSNPSLISDAVLKQARRLVPPGRTDTTRTDYFRLKALGVNPDTPIIPASRKRRVPENCEDMSSRKSSRASPPESSRPSSSQSMRPPIANSSTIRRRTSVTSTTNDDDDDELFAQMAEVRNAMAESINWFREEREKSEKSPSSSGATRDQRQETEKERKLREFQYTPSRTEIRLKATGAHGLLPRNWGQRNGDVAVSGSAGEEMAAQAPPRQQGFAAFGNHGLSTQMGPAQGFAAYGNGFEEAMFGGAQSQREGSGSGTGAHQDDAIELSD